MDKWIKSGLLVVLLLVFGLAPADERVTLALPDLDGKLHDISQYRGKWVVINYWATWCPPCVYEIPELVAFHARHSETDAVVIGVNAETLDTEMLRDFVAKFEINYPILLENPDRMSPMSRVFGLPTTYIVRPDGKLAARRNGPVTAEQLELMIRAPVTNAEVKARRT